MLSDAYLVFFFNAEDMQCVSRQRKRNTNLGEKQSLENTGTYILVLSSTINLELQAMFT